MKYHVHSWIKWWLLLSGLIVLYDAGYALMRPYTLEGGPLFAIWKPYQYYGTVDLIYSVDRYHAGDRFCEAQGICNVVEVVLQLYALHLLNSRGKDSREAAGVLLAFTTQAFTFWKTSLYWLYDIVGGFSHTGHNDIMTAVFVYGLTNIWWIVLPFFAMLHLGTLIWRCLQRSPQKSA
mmetsp:Transcript_26038/g.70520  ORF Transcript_26038/g.70520 Transcript_26038/m.70520 type:complete len:178 (+) Transcript_26038:1395-1928(+)